MAQTVTIKMYKDSNYYFVNSAEADQGAVGAGLSVKDIVDAVGTTKNATIVFGHSGAGNTTTYSFGTSETITTNINVIMEAGARLAIATGVTLTINGPFQANKRLQCIALTGTGVVSFGEESVSEVYPEWWGGVADGSTVVTTQINNALTAITRGVVKLAPGVYDTGGTVIYILGTGKHLVGSGIDATFLEGDADSNVHISMGNASTTAQGCSVRDLTMFRAAGTLDSDGHGIYATNFLHCFVQNIKVRREYNAFVIISETGFSNASFGFKVLGCFIEEVPGIAFYVGAASDTVSNVVIDGNTIGNAGKGGGNTLTANYFLYTDGTPDSVAFINNIAMYAADTAEIGNRTSFTNLVVKNNIGISSDIFATKTYDAPEIAAASYAATSWNDITGAALGDIAIAALEVDVANLVVDARVIAADTVEITLYNNTVGAINLASTTVNVRVIKAEV